MYIPTYDDMLAAHERIRPHIRQTPVRTSDYLNELSGAELFFKCENFQEPGAFKVRGASNAVFGLTEDQAKKGVATHSSGNHASCLSYAAMLRGIPCNVVMPRTAPQAKKDTVRRYGGVITECEPSTSSREATFAEVQARHGRRFRASLQRPARHCRTGHLFPRVHRTDGWSGHGGGAHWRWRHDLGHLSDFVHARARDESDRRGTRTGR
jgi:threonine dehydratase